MRKKIIDMDHFGGALAVPCRAFHVLVLKEHETKHFPSYPWEKKEAMAPCTSDLHNQNWEWVPAMHENTRQILGGDSTGEREPACKGSAWLHCLPDLTFISVGQALTPLFLVVLTYKGVRGARLPLCQGQKDERVCKVLWDLLMRWWWVIQISIVSHGRIKGKRSPFPGDKIAEVSCCKQDSWKMSSSLSWPSGFHSEVFVLWFNILFTC